MSEKMLKKPTGLIEIKGKHRVRFESVVEYNPNGYPEGVVFAEIYENMHHHTVLRMQLRNEDLWELVEGAKEIIAIADAIPSSNETAKKLGGYVKYTESGGVKNKLYFGVAKSQTPLYYLNFTQEKGGAKKTLNISLSPLVMAAWIERMAHFAQCADRSLFAYYSKGVHHEQQ